MDFRLSLKKTEKLNWIKESKLCVLTPIYKDIVSEQELLSIELCLMYLKSFDLYIICPNKLEGGFLHNRLNNFYNFIFLNDEHFKDISAYNNLLLSHNFYEVFSNYEFMLIYQLDALIFNSNIIDWIEKDYSYVGAPWLWGERKSLNKDQVFMGVGNGGFSLRKIKHMIWVLKSNKKLNSFLDYIFNGSTKRNTYYYIKNTFYYFKYLDRFNTVKDNSQYNEDIIFSKAKDRFSFFKIPEPKEALSFSFEMNPKLLYEMNDQKLPLGCHAWQKYDPDFYTEIINKLKNQYTAQFIIK